MIQSWKALWLAFALIGCSSTGIGSESAKGSVRFEEVTIDDPYDGEVTLCYLVNSTVHTLWWLDDLASSSLEVWHGGGWLPLKPSVVSNDLVRWQEVLPNDSLRFSFIPDLVSRSVREGHLISSSGVDFDPRGPYRYVAGVLIQDEPPEVDAATLSSARQITSASLFAE